MSSPNSNSSSKCGTLDAINSTSFDPDQYMHLLVRSPTLMSNLEALLQRHVEMAAEIKNLDTDLQISANTGHITFIVMKSNIVGMEANMEQLLKKIMSVRSRGAGVNTRLFEKREHTTFFVKFRLLAIFVVASTDQTNIDRLLPFMLGITIAMFFTVLAIFIIVCQYSCPTVFLLIPLAWLKVWYRGYFLASSRELT
ncbi:unnamed protein product [Malus baccata var. baccata]